MNLATILSAAGLLEKLGQLIAAAPDAIAAAQKFGSQAMTTVKILTGEVTGQAALDHIIETQADIDMHFQHMEDEAAKLGQ